MITFTSNVDEVAAKMQQLPSVVEQAAAISIARGAQIVHREVVKAIEAVHAVASTDLVKSVTVSPITIGVGGIQGTVSSDKEYAPVVEYGRRPGRRPPPRDRILEWMVLKGLEPSESGAYLIARKIGRDGIEGKHPFQKGVENAMPEVEQEAVKEIAIKIADFFTEGQASNVVGEIRQYTDAI